MRYGVWVPESDHSAITTWFAELDSLAAEADTDCAVFAARSEDLAARSEDFAARSEDKRRLATHYRDMRRRLVDQALAEVDRPAKNDSSEDAALETVADIEDRSVRRMAQRGEVKQQMLMIMRKQPHRGWRPKELADALAPLTSIAYVRNLLRTLVRNHQLIQDDDIGLYRIAGLTVVADDAAARDREVAM